MAGLRDSALTDEQLDILALARQHQHLYLEFEGDSTSPARLVYETSVEGEEERAESVRLVGEGHEVELSRYGVLRELLEADLLARDGLADYDAECDGVSVRALAYRLSPAGIAALVGRLFDAGERAPVALSSQTALPLIDQPVFWSDTENISLHVDAVIYFERGIHPRPHPIERMVDLLGAEHAMDPTVITLVFQAEEAHRQLTEAYLAGRKPAELTLRAYERACEVLAALVLQRYSDPSSHAVMRIHDPRSGEEAWFLLPLDVATRYQEYFERLNREATAQGLLAA